MEDEDQELAASIIRHIRTLMKEILKLKQDKPDQVRIAESNWLIGMIVLYMFLILWSTWLIGMNM